MRCVLFAVAVGLILLPTLTSAQEATPTPIPILVPEIEGVQNAATRTFESTGFRIAEPIFLAVGVVRFDSDDHARDAMQTIQERELARLAQGGDVSGIKRASANQIGDETRAFAGPLKLADQETLVPEYSIGFALVRRDQFVFLGVAASIGGDSISPALDVVRKVVDRQPGSEATPIGDGDMRVGGLWDMLPTLGDVPEGMIFSEDRSPIPFEPLPGQENAD